MTQQLRVIVVGLGEHGKDIVRAVDDAGMVVAGAVDPAYAGQDLGAVTDVPGLAGRTVAGELADLPAPDGSADVILVAAKLPIAALVPLLKDSLARGADVLTIVEDAFDLHSFAPELYGDLDAAAKRAGKTVVATGVQDAAWTGLVLQATALQLQLGPIRLEQHLGVDGYPQEFVTWVGIGSTPQEFEAAATEAAKTPSVFGATLPVIARKLGLTVTGQSRRMSPYVIDTPVESITLGRTITAGEPIGRRDVVTVHTVEGIDLVAELVTSVLMDQDDFHAVLGGFPAVELTHRMTPGPPTVNASLINRIPDVLAAPAGVVSTVDLPTPFHRHGSGAPVVAR
ncbi:hypothetical protein [Rhodococcus sp. NPDC057529]|uniref:hypothetical protein n=1 Tax=Rhodococcus sp. NPDC057529 TaxID=3346158 RepID=UPI0036700A5E